MSVDSGSDGVDSSVGFDVGERYFPSDHSIDAVQRRKLRSHYGWVRTYFKTRPGRFGSVRRWLNQARIDTTHDVYLARSVWLAVVAALLGVVLGATLAYGLQAQGILAGLTSPVEVPGDVGEFVGRNRLWFAGGTLAVASGLAFGLGAWLVRYYYPRFLVGERSRAIDLMLPHSITYMYALNHGGMNLVEVVESMADATDSYDEVANEFDLIVRDMDVFGTDLITAVRNARNVTPSDSMERFLDDLLSVLDSGGDTSRFFEEQSEKYLKEAKERQEFFMETLALLSEVFIFAFVAAPLFLMVTLMVISFLGGNTLLAMVVGVYVVLPLGMIGFVLLVDVLSAPYTSPPAVFDPGDELGEASETVRGDPRYANYRRTKRNKRLKGLLRDPLGSVEENPLLSMVVTLPVAVAFGAAMVLQGFATASVAAVTGAPVRTTTLLVVVPALVVVVPLSLFYERKRRRQNQITQRFPDMLNVLSSANSMGVRLTDAFGLVSRYSTGVLARETQKVRNDVEWNRDLRIALLKLANRLKAPHLSRTIKLVADGGRSSGDLTRILSIAAEDTHNRARLERDRRQAMSSYIAIVVIGFLVYLMVIVLIDTAYLSQFAALAAEQGPDTRDLPVSLSSVPVETYRALFFHSVLIQGFGAGLLAGKLADNRALSGLKYSVALTALSVGVFLLI
jgi:flagellar protein FlaJ